MLSFQPISRGPPFRGGPVTRSSKGLNPALTEFFLPALVVAADGNCAL